MENLKNPWTTISSKQIYDNHWITVTEAEVINPGGGKGIYGKVSFKNFAIGIIPLDDKNNTWLVGQYRYPLDEYSWEIPMGGGPLQDNPLATAKRELAEETGLIASDWENIMKIHTSNSVTDETGYVFVARGLTYDTNSLEETESDLIVKKLPFVEAVDMVMQGKITDSLSVGGLLKLDRILTFSH